MPANEQCVVRSPEPRISHFCLGMATMNLTALVMACHYREQPIAEYGGFFWAKLVGIATSLILLAVHANLRFSSYDEEHHGIFHRAMPFCSGLVAVCAMTILNTLLWPEGFPTYLLAYQAEMWFWIGYWSEWWTAILGDVLAGFGC
ncbi:hypothetical protein PG985_010953 [Apiospora marii]|uniref:Uncharacterized protein n=1 Tax=Apiospora marii TaxID=335849 RepID=A0ABR1SU43_9PEZI